MQKTYSRLYEKTPKEETADNTAQEIDGHEDNLDSRRRQLDKEHNYQEFNILRLQHSGELSAKLKYYCHERIEDSGENRQPYSVPVSTYEWENYIRTNERTIYVRIGNYYISHLKSISMLADAKTRAISTKTRAISTIWSSMYKR